MFEWLKNFFFNNKARIQAIAERIKRFMDRFETTKEEENYLLSQRYYYLVLNSKTLEEAKHYEKEFYNHLIKKGILNKEYEESKDYADGSYDNPNYTSSDNAAALYTYTQTSPESSSTSEVFSGEGGEFGGAGASSSWEETTSDNS